MSLVSVTGSYSEDEPGRARPYPENITEAVSMVKFSPTVGIYQQKQTKMTEARVSFVCNYGLTGVLPIYHHRYTTIRNSNLS